MTKALPMNGSRSHTAALGASKARLVPCVLLTNIVANYEDTSGRRIKPIAHAVHRSNTFAIRIYGLNLSPQVLYMTVNGSIAGIPKVGVQSVKQLFPRINPTGIADKAFQQAEFQWRQG
jgi:hypothetical protein